MKQRDAALITDMAPLAVQDYEFLRYSNDRSIKDAFIAGTVTDPGLYYSDIDPAHIEERLEDVAALETIVTVYGDELVRRTYQDKLRETREKYELLQAAQRGDDAAMMDASVRLYGQPREDMFRFALKGLAERVERVEEVWGTDAHVQELMLRLKALPSVERSEPFPWESIPLPEVRVYEETEPLQAAQIREEIQQAFVRYGIEDWQAVVDAPGERTTFNTNHELRTIFIPSDEDIAMRKYALTKDRVDALIAHEVGTHVLRRANGEKSPLALLGIGLAGYLRGEEGVATYEEQLLDGTRHFAGGLGYLAVGLVCGLDGTPRNFRGLYELMHAYLVVSALEHALAYNEEVSTEAVIARAQRRAWARCVRTFRGTSGTTPGACFTKDIVYLEGNIATWELIAEDPTWEDRFFLGKYDPANPEHVAVMQELGLF